MKIIEIKYKNEIKECFIDDEDFDLINQYFWFYCHGYVYGFLKGIKKPYRMTFIHRVIMGLERGNKIQVDHKDHNGLNNQKINLRYSTQQQNCWNVSPNKNGTSKYLGVTKKRNRKKCKDGYHYYGIRYIPKIRIKNKTKYLGSYLTEEVAAKIYDKVASLLYGEFANLNFK